jgi:hypothetical protein
MLDFTIKDVSKYPNVIDLQIYINNGTQLFADVQFNKFSSITALRRKYDLDHKVSIERAVSIKKDIINLDEDDVYFERDVLEASGRKYEHLPHCSDEDYKRLLKDCFMYIIEHYSPSTLGCLVRLIGYSSEHYKLVEQFLTSEGFLTPKDLGQRVHSKGQVYADPNKGRNTFKKQLFILQN